MKMPKITDAEWQIMKIIWENQFCTANDIVKEISQTTDWKPSTTRTLINRLLKKNVLSYEVDKNDNKTYHYFALVSKNDCIRSESESFMKRVFNGSLNVMLENFIKDSKLSEEEIDKLKQILDNKKG